jgi:hypothetical protein
MSLDTSHVGVSACRRLAITISVSQAARGRDLSVYKYEGMKLPERSSAGFSFESRL